MSGRYRFVARLRKQLQLYKLSNSSRNPLGYLFGRKSNPNKISQRKPDKEFFARVEAKQRSLLSHQWAHSESLQSKWRKLKNLWFDARTSRIAISSAFQGAG